MYLRGAISSRGSPASDAVTLDLALAERSDAFSVIGVILS